MSDVFADRLVNAIQQKGSPICVGIDPIFEMLPDGIAGVASKHKSDDAEAAIDAIFAFTTAVLRIVAPHVPCVKFQSAYFEKYLWEGVEAYYSLLAEARELGLVVIGDVKRGDIGPTSAAYAAGHLAQPHFEELDDMVLPDAITVNPFCGLDAIEPFVQAAKKENKGLFVLVRTSNPGSAQLQDALLADGRTWSEMLADALAPLAEAPELMGRSGWSSLGAVVGATQEHTMQSLRSRLPHSFFLLPGYGAQGATADDCRACFDAQGRGAVVNSSRGIIFAWRRPDRPQTPPDWDLTVAGAAAKMKEELERVRLNEIGKL